MLGKPLYTPISGLDSSHPPARGLFPFPSAASQPDVLSPMPRSPCPRLSAQGPKDAEGSRVDTGSHSSHPPASPQPRLKWGQRCRLALLSSSSIPCSWAPTVGSLAGAPDLLSGPFPGPGGDAGAFQRAEHSHGGATDGAKPTYFCFLEFHFYFWWNIKALTISQIGKSTFFFLDCLTISGLTVKEPALLRRLGPDGR